MNRESSEKDSLRTFGSKIKWKNWCFSTLDHTILHNLRRKNHKIILDDKGNPWCPDRKHTKNSHGKSVAVLGTAGPGVEIICGALIREFVDN